MAARLVPHRIREIRESEFLGRLRDEPIDRYERLTQSPRESGVRSRGLCGMHFPASLHVS
jgi:hypothetical protein